MIGKTYTKQEEEILFSRLNKHLGKTGHVQWRNVRPLHGRNLKSMSNHWQHMKRLYTFNGNQWVLKQHDLFNQLKPTRLLKKTKKNDKPQTILEKRVVVKKSLLWGAYTFERYE
jgi:hypothetical protein